MASLMSQFASCNHFRRSDLSFNILVPPAESDPLILYLDSAAHQHHPIPPLFPPLCPLISTFTMPSTTADHITTPSHSSSFNLRSVQSDESRICVVMVGLPARGKSLIAGKGMFKPE